MNTDFPAQFFQRQDESAAENFYNRSIVKTNHIFCDLALNGHVEFSNC